MPLSRLRSLHLEDPHGQTMSETAVVLSLVVIVVMIAVFFYGNRLGALWAMLSSTLPGG